MPCDDPGVVNRSKAPVHRGFRPDWAGLRQCALTAVAPRPHRRSTPGVCSGGTLRTTARTGERDVREPEGHEEACAAGGTSGTAGEIAVDLMPETANAPKNART
ncbi:hypothetical protein Saso_37230 [Streptomyces asoensis]|uniref:Uncharacterized protein n=1 Tax=Streptomyces asoensis TaxID=249586 RepID=A0ABQ3S1S2_9ACTN|nr:hypothetical protein GCM10010496_42740 [Streptomyces asoensis]GHI62073.1 hypothetical protein Saso_37230 [Streptomyces asoensis]